MKRISKGIVVPALLARVCPFWHVGADRARTAPVGDYRTCSCCCAHACMLIVRILVVFGCLLPETLLGVRRK